LDISWNKPAVGLLVAGALALGTAATVSAQPAGEFGADPQHKNHVSDWMLEHADKDPSNWLHYGKDYESTRYVQAAQINRSNVKSLVPKWQVSFGKLEGQDSQGVAVNGTVFVTTSFNRVISIDGRNGDIDWVYTRDLPADVYPQLCCDVVNRGVAPYIDNVYLATLDAHIVALNAASGEVVFDVAVGDYTYAETFTVMPMALDGKVIMGTAGAEYGVRGWVTARSAEDGSEVWKTYTIPEGGIVDGQETWLGDSWKYGGGSGWITGSYDHELNLLYWPVGNPGPDFDRHVRCEDPTVHTNLYSNSTIVMDPDSGEIKFHFQYTPCDPYDYDGINEVILADVSGKKVWLHGDRNGYLYSIDRSNGQCNWVVPLGTVDWNAGFGDNCTPIMDWPKMDVTYDKVTRVWPTLDGGKEWHPMAYSKRSGLVYVPTYNFYMDLQAGLMEWNAGEWYLGSSILRFGSGNGAVNAYDAATGDMIWTRPSAAPATGGIMATAGGLVFFGGADGHFQAANDETGEALWSFQTGSGVHGNPTSYTVEGEQYVTIVSGAGGGGLWPLTYGDWLQTHTKGGMIIAFGLH